MAMNLKRKEAEAQRLLQDTEEGPSNSSAASKEAASLTVSPGGMKAIVINGMSPPKQYHPPPASMPAFMDSNEFGHVKKLTRKTSLKV